MANLRERQLRRTPDMPEFDKSKYDQEYAKKNIIQKRIPFNRSIPDDARMLDFLSTIENFTGYVKNLIREDMASRH